MSDRHEIILLVDATGATRAFQAVGADAAKATSQLERIGVAGSTSLGRTAAAAQPAAAGLAKVSSSLSVIERAASGAALASVVGFLADSARAAADAELSQARLAQAFENVNSSIEAHATRLDAAAAAALRLAYDDEDAADAIASLAALTGDANQAIDLLGLSMDLARARGMDLASAATLVGKVAQGNTSILSRYGIVLREGATAEEALASLQERYAGQAETYANTQRGAIDRLAVSYGNLQERLGGVAGPAQALLGALPGVTAGFQLTAGAAAALTERLAGTRGLRAGLGAVTAAITPMTLGLGAATAAAGVAILAFQQHEDGIRALESAYTDVNKAILANLDATNRQAAGGIAFAGIDYKTPLDVAPWTAAGQEIFAVQQRLGNYALTVEDVLLDTAAAARVTRDMGAAFAAVGPEMEGSVVRAFTLLAEQYEAQIALAPQVQAASAQIAALLAEEGTRGEVADQQLAKLLDTYTRTGDVAAFVSGLDAATASLGEQAIAASTAADAVIAYSEEQRRAIAQLPDLIASAADASVQAVRDQQAALGDAADAAAEAATAAAERAGAQQTRAAERAGSETARAASAAGREQTRAAEQAETAQVRAAEQAAAGQIAAAEAAETAQVEAAQSAADAQVAEAERSERVQVRAAESAARSQTQAAERAGREQVRAATLAANEQTRQADRMEASVAEAATARADAIVEAARAAHEARVESADDAAAAEIAAAKRSTEATLIELERRTAAQARAATDEASATIQDANDAAFRRIRAAEGTPGHGRVVAEEAKRLAKVQSEAYAEQERSQANALRRQEEGAAKAEAAEERRIAAAEETRTAAAEASARRLAAIEEQAQAEAAARTEAAAREAERIRTDAARNVAQVERETARATAGVARAAAQDAARITRAAARETAQVQEQAAANVAATQEAAAANTARVTAQANQAAERESAQAARATERVRTGAARAVAIAERSTGREVRGIARETARAQEQAAQEREAVAVAAARAVESAEQDAARAADAATAAVLIGAAEADPALAEMLTAQGLLRQGASGEFEVIISDPSAQALARIESIFGSDVASLSAQGQIEIVADFSPLNAAIAEANGTTVGEVRMAVRPAGARQAGQYTAGRGYADGGVVPASRVVTVGERGPERVYLPGGSYVSPAPATAAGGGGLPAITLQFNAPVYGLDDFRGQVGRAAAEVLGRALPAAIADRRRALGG